MILLKDFCEKYFLNTKMVLNMSYKGIFKEDLTGHFLKKEHLGQRRVFVIDEIAFLTDLLKFNYVKDEQSKILITEELDKHEKIKEDLSNEFLLLRNFADRFLFKETYLINFISKPKYKDFVEKRKHMTYLPVAKKYVPYPRIFVKQPYELLKTLLYSSTKISREQEMLIKEFLRDYEKNAERTVKKKINKAIKQEYDNNSLEIKSCVYTEEVDGYVTTANCGRYIYKGFGLDEIQSKNNMLLAFKRRDVSGTLY